MKFRWRKTSASSDDVETQAHQAVADERPELQTLRSPEGRRTSTLTFGDRTFPLRPGTNVIGRGARSAVIIESPAVSRRHAQVIIGGDRAVLEDLGSKNGTFLDNRRVDLPLEIPDSAAIRLGSVWLFFRSGDGTEE